MTKVCGRWVALGIDESRELGFVTVVERHRERDRLRPGSHTKVADVGTMRNVGGYVQLRHLRPRALRQSGDEDRCGRERDELTNFDHDSSDASVGYSPVYARLPDTD